MKDFKILLLNFSFVVIYIIHAMLILLKNNLNYFKNSIFECFFKEYKRLLIFLNNYFHKIKLSLEEENITKDIKNIFRLKKKN